MNLHDDELINKCIDNKKAEHELLTVVLRYLQEVERRKLYLKRGYSSMFAFCTELVGYSESEAHLRIQAMRLMTSVPMVEQKIGSGELSLTVAAKAQGCFRRAKKPVANKTEIVESLVGKSSREAERELASIFPEMPKPEVVRAVSDEKTRLEFTISKACLEKLNRFKELAAHKNFDGRLEVMFEELLDLGLKKYEKVAAGEIVARDSVTPSSVASNSGTPEPGAPKPGAPKSDAAILGAHQVIIKKSAVPRGESPVVKRSRYIAVPVEREVWRRAENGCEYRDGQTGHRCSCRYGLQIDHIVEFAKGGPNTLKNLQLLCGAHNRWRSRATG